MKTEEYRQLTDEQLDLSLKDVIKNLFHLRFQSATERLETPSEIRKAKREVARIKTIQRERVLKIRGAALSSGPCARLPGETPAGDLPGDGPHSGGDPQRYRRPGRDLYSALDRDEPGGDGAEAEVGEAKEAEVDHQRHTGDSHDAAEGADIAAGGLRQ